MLVFATSPSTQHESERAEILRREQAARSEAEVAAQQSWLLAEASRMLTLSADYTTTLTGLARLTAGSLADWCVIDLVGDDGVLHRLAVAHADPAREKLARLYQARPVTGADLPEALAEALASGQAELLAEVTEDDRQRLVRGEEQARLVDGLGLRSVMLVPLVSRGHVVGTLMVVRGRGEPYTADDLVTTQELVTGRRPPSITAASTGRPRKPTRASPGSSTASTRSSGKPTPPRWTSRSSATAPKACSATRCGSGRATARSGRG